MKRVTVWQGHCLLPIVGSNYIKPAKCTWYLVNGAPWKIQQVPCFQDCIHNRGAYLILAEVGYRNSTRHTNDTTQSNLVHEPTQHTLKGLTINYTKMYKIFSNLLHTQCMCVSLPVLTTRVSWQQLTAIPGMIKGRENIAAQLHVYMYMNKHRL